MATDSSSKRSRRLRKMGVRGGFVLLTLVTLAVLLVAFENWSGAREWARVREKLVSGGVEMDPKKLVSEMPASEQNFGAFPMIAALTRFSTDEEGGVQYENPELVDRFRRIALPDPEVPVDLFPSWSQRNPADFSAFAEALGEGKGSDGGEPPAETILAWMQEMASDLSELDRAAERPAAVLPFDLADDFLSRLSMQLPFLRDYQTFQRFQSIRVCAALEAGDHEQARAGILAMLQTGRAVGSQPFLISHLVQLNCHEMTLSALWYGMNSGLWREEDLRWLDSELSREPEALLENLETALNLELCIMSMGAFDFLKTPEAHSIDLISLLEGGGANRGTNLVLSLIPDGTWDHNKAFATEQMFDTALEPAMRRALPRDDSHYLKLKRTPRNFMARIIAPAFSGIVFKAFQSAVATEFARVAMALERYRMKEGRYPTALEDLVPGFLPALPEDRFSPDGTAFRYQRSGDRYQIYSVGQNGTDEGGVPVYRTAKERKIDPKKGDLIWGYGE